MLPRCVIVERATEYRALLARHGTREQVRFFLEQRALRVEDVEARHLAYEETRAAVLGAVPGEWRRATVDRAELDRFLFTADDVVVVLGQDGLVANLAKYLDGQPVIGLNAEPDRNAGVLVRHPPAAAADLIADVAAGRAHLEERTMVAAALDDGQRLLALNEVFVGHVGHQSARYTLAVGGASERQSSSGLIVATGTGATGWAASLNRLQPAPLALPGAGDGALAWFVREAWPSRATGTALTAGLLDDGERLVVTCELSEGGVAFGDGIEADSLRLDWGQRLTVSRAERALRLVA
jgi:NAD kinase